jgi:hypothetical protein
MKEICAWNIGGNILTGEDRSTRRQTYASSTLHQSSSVDFCYRKSYRVPLQISCVEFVGRSIKDSHHYDVHSRSLTGTLYTIFCYLSSYKQIKYLTPLVRLLPLSKQKAVMFFRSAQKNCLNKSCVFLTSVTRHHFSGVSVPPHEFRVMSKDNNAHAEFSYSLSAGSC